MQRYELSQEMIEKLNRIYNYFGGGSKLEAYENKMERLFLEAGELRDAVILNQPSKKKTKEITDIISCALQLLINNKEIQDQLEKTVDFTIERIASGYYSS